MQCLKNNITAIFLYIIIQVQLLGQITNDLPKTFLMETQDNVVFDMSMSYKDYYGSGLLVLKRESKGNYHGVFLSKVGLKLMEFKIVEGEFEWIKLLEYIDKKATRKLLERDFSMLMLSDLDNAKKIKSLSRINEHDRFKVDGDRKLLIEVNNGLIRKVENKKIINLTKTMITFVYDEENTPKSVSLTHKTIKINLQLELLEQ